VLDPTPNRPVPPPLLEAKGVRKHFPGVQALDGVSLHVRAGEVLAVVGENGAGKSTLMKVLAGIYAPDAGELFLDGHLVRFAGVAEAIRRGIMLIHQELNLAENLSVSANLFLGRERVRGGLLGWLDQGRMNDEARVLLARVGLDVPPGRPVGELPPGQRQLVEIARALSLDARLIIMDEPTSSLTQSETDRLFQVIADLKRANVAVLYISHRLGEVRQVADRVTVLRDGRNAGELARAEVSHDALVRLMVGRDLKQLYPRRHSRRPDAPVRLAVHGLTYAGGPTTPISFEVRGGEIVGVAGLVGAGRTEVAEALFGIRAVRSGEVLLDGAPVRALAAGMHPAAAVDAGLLLVPEDRRRHGLVLIDSVRDNLALPNLDRLSVLGWVLPGRVVGLCRRLMEQLRVRASGPAQPVGLLSGGNQQKVVLGKWLARRPRVLILDEPTRGVDVGARSEIYALMDELAGEGVAVLMISSDLEEVLGMSDRVLVLYQGRLAGELARADLSEEAVMHLATGGTGAAAAKGPRGERGESGVPS
jgi:ribose transport system ATP-binding protein